MYPSGTLILRLFQEPRVFDLDYRPLAADDVCDFARGVVLAVDAGLIGIRRGVAGGDDVGQREEIMIG